MNVIYIYFLDTFLEKYISSCSWEKAKKFEESFLNFEYWAVQKRVDLVDLVDLQDLQDHLWIPKAQKRVDLVDLVKSFQTSICLQNSASMQPRTSFSKFAKN